MSTLMQDLRYAFRRLRQSPGFTVVCVITLALAIGANTAIFTLVDAVMLKSLPVTNPKELYRLGNNNNCCVIGGFQDNWAIYSNFAITRPNSARWPPSRQACPPLVFAAPAPPGRPSLAWANSYPGTTFRCLVSALSPGALSRPRTTRLTPHRWP